MPIARKLYLMVGVIPIRDHYYDPFYQPETLKDTLNLARYLPGIDMNEAEQLRLLDRLTFQSELECFPLEKQATGDFYYHNDFFSCGDAEYLYSMIRLFKPKRIIEVGSGNSTLMMHNAIAENRREDRDYRCDLLCIEPYEADWLESHGIAVIRKPVEEVDTLLFERLAENDLLFIDSSHVIKPQRDVLHLYLRVLPQLRPGVFVQIHDVLTPHDYFPRWVKEEIRLWNEQYLVEAFLSHNSQFKVIGALNYLKHRHFDRLAAALPILGREPWSEPGSLWLQRVAA